MNWLRTQTHETCDQKHLSFQRWSHDQRLVCVHKRCMIFPLLESRTLSWILLLELMGTQELYVLILSCAEVHYETTSQKTVEFIQLNTVDVANLMKARDSRLASNTLYLMNPGTSCSVHNCKTTEQNQCD